MHRLLSLRTLTVLSLATMLCRPVSVAAQSAEARWVVVPIVLHGEELPSWSGAAVQVLTDAIAAKDIASWAPSDAQQFFESEHSTESAAITQDDVLTLRRLADTALKSIAAADPRTALVQLNAAARQYSQAPDEYNREDAKLVLDLCLFRARAMLETSTEAAKVKEELRECRMRIPLEVEVDWMKHTNVTVRQLVRDVVTDLVSQRTGRLEVRTRESCQVRVDGIDLGLTQDGVFRANDLVRGAHRVSVLCNGRPGRVHIVKIGDSPATLTVDAAFERTVHTRPLVHLRLGRGDEVSLARYVTALETSLSHGTEVVAMRRAQGGGVLLERYQDGGRVIAANLPSPAQVKEPWPEEECSRAVLALQGGLSRQTTGPTLGTSSPRRASESPRFGETELRRTRVSNIVLLSLAVPLTVATGALHLAARSKRSADEQEYNMRAANYDSSLPGERLGNTSIITGISGALLLGVAHTGFLKHRFGYHKPNLVLLTSTLVTGGALIGLGAWQYRVSAKACDSCAVERNNATELGVLLTTYGETLALASLFSALVFELPEYIRGRRRATAKLSAGIGTINLTGSF